jgi:hypothetical protein
MVRPGFNFFLAPPLEGGRKEAGAQHDKGPPSCAVRERQGKTRTSTSAEEKKERYDQGEGAVAAGHGDARLAQGWEWLARA